MSLKEKGKIITENISPFLGYSIMAFICVVYKIWWEEKSSSVYNEDNRENN